MKTLEKQQIERTLVTTSAANTFRKNLRARPLMEAAMVAIMQAHDDGYQHGVENALAMAKERSKAKGRQ